MLGFLAWPGGTPPAGAADAAEPRRQLDAVEKEIGKSQEQQRELRQDAERLQREVQAIGQKLADTAERVQAAELRLSDAEARAAALQAEIATQRQDLQANREELARLAETLARLARQPPGTALLAPGGTLQVVRGSRLLAAAGESIADQVAALNQRLARLAEHESDLATEQARLATEQSTLALERRRLADLLRQRELDEGHARQAGQQESLRLAGLTGQAADLKQLVRRLEEEAQARRAAEEQARRAEQERQRAETESRQSQPRRAEPAVLQPADPGLAKDAVAQPFAKARGLILSPVAGETIGQFGESNAAGQRARGWRIATRSEATVVAPYHGRVAFAGPFRDYGLVLILAHGDGYHVLLAGLARLHTEVGHSVRRGEPVGEMGRGEGERTLYLEVRAKGEPIDPAAWIAPPKGKVSG